MTVAVIDYTDPAQMLADYAARRRRMYQRTPEPQAVKSTPAAVKPKILVFPVSRPVTIDEVIARYRYAHPRCRTAFEYRPPGHDDTRSIVDIVREVSQKHNVPVREILGACRTKGIVLARQESMWLVAKLTGHSLAAIGRAIGGKDHTTVIHAIRCHNERTGENVRSLGLVPIKRKIASAAYHARNPGRKRMTKRVA